MATGPIDSQVSGRSPETRLIPSVPREAGEAIKAVFDALSEWRDEVSSSTERYSENVLDKMAAAARALGWPKEFVDASRSHLVQASKAQMHLIDQFMDAWEKQLNAPTSDQVMAQLRKFSGAGFAAMPMSSPFDLWMQTTEMWQRNWTTALSVWNNPGQHDNTDAMPQTLLAVNGSLVPKSAAWP